MAAILALSLSFFQAAWKAARALLHSSSECFGSWDATRSAAVTIQLIGTSPSSFWEWNPSRGEEFLNFAIQGRISLKRRSDWRDFRVEDTILSMVAWFVMALSVQDTETILKTHSQAYQAALVEYDRAVGMIDSDPKGALDLIEKVFAAPK